jgi:hypothetical protein
MNLRADLHLHTTASDGRWPPRQLIDELVRAGIGLFAVTDHDSLASLAETTGVVHGSGLRFLPGVELSTRLNGQLYHLLGYGFDPGDEVLQAFVQANNARLAQSSDDAIHVLMEAGHPISLDGYDTYTWDRRRGGWKALNFLIDQGLCRDVRHYFDDLFGEIAHPQAAFPPPEEAIAAVQGAGGLVILAHPGAAFCNGVGTQHLDQLVEMGLSGVECYSFHHDAAMTQSYLDYCRRRDLLITGGSDCHGGFAGRALGVPPVKESDLRLGVLEERLIT